MAQQDPADFPINPSSVSGNQLADILNEFHDALKTGRKGPSRPAVISAGGSWVDDSVVNKLKFKIFNGTDDKEILEIDLLTDQTSILGILEGTLKSDSTGLGIGDFSASTPDNALHIKKTFAAIKLEDTDGDGDHALIYTDSAGTLNLSADHGNGGSDVGLRLLVNGAANSRLTSTGLMVGSGDSPSTALHIKDDVTVIRLEDTDGGGSYADIVNDANGSLYFKTDPTNANPTGTVQMQQIDGTYMTRLNTTGLLLGDAANSSAAATALHVKDQKAIIRWEDSDGTAHNQIQSDTNGSFFYHADTANLGANSLHRWYVDGSEKLRLGSDSEHRLVDAAGRYKIGTNQIRDITDISTIKSETDGSTTSTSSAYFGDAMYYYPPVADGTARYLITFNIRYQVSGTNANSNVQAVIEPRYYDGTTYSPIRNLAAVNSSAAGYAEVGDGGRLYYNGGPGTFQGHLSFTFDVDNTIFRPGYDAMLLRMGGFVSQASTTLTIYGWQAVITEYLV